MKDNGSTFRGDQFTARFGAEQYLVDYYGKSGENIGFENDSLLRFYAQIYQDIGQDAKVLEVGSGPTCYPLISAAPKIKRWDAADYLGENLEKIREVKDGDPNAYDWSHFIKRALELEGKREVTEEEVKERSELMRSKIGNLLPCNALLADPIVPEYRGTYDIVSMNFVAESITSDLETWKRIMKNVTSLLKPGGDFVMTALEGASFYNVGGKIFPAVNLSASQVKCTLAEIGVQKEDLQTISSEYAVRKNAAHGRKPRFHGYEGMIFYHGKKDQVPQPSFSSNGNGNGSLRSIRQNSRTAGYPAA